MAKSLELSATNQAHVGVVRLDKRSEGAAKAEIDEPRLLRSQGIRRSRPQGPSAGIRKIVRIDARILCTDMNQGEQFALGRQAPVGVGAQCCGVHRRDECLGVAQVAGQGGVAGAMPPVLPALPPLVLPLLLYQV